MLGYKSQKVACFHNIHRQNVRRDRLFSECWLPKIVDKPIR
jgi:hypothetical protein